MKLRGEYFCDGCAGLVPRYSTAIIIKGKIYCPFCVENMDLTKECVEKNSFTVSDLMEYEIERLSGLGEEVL